MKVYHRREARLGKWIVAAITFLVIMTVTFADAYGVGVPKKPNKPGNGGWKNQDPPPATIQTQSDMRTQESPNPSPVPEPSTMILMGLGLGAAAVARKFRKAE